MADLGKKDVWDDLMSVALSDGIITDDENKLITNFLNNLEKYQVLLDESLEDGIIDDYEKNFLLNQRIKIFNKIKYIAKDDLVITEDEEQLIGIIQKLITDMKE